MSARTKKTAATSAPKPKAAPQAAKLPAKKTQAAVPAKKIPAAVPAKAEAAKAPKAKTEAAKAPKPKASAPRKTSLEVTLARVEAVRLEQRTEGYFDCFGRAASGYCDQGGCVFHAECLSVSRLLHSL